LSADGQEFFTSYDEVYDSFDAMGLQENLLRGIYAYGFERPSAIQQRGIVPFCKGLDVIQQAQSGTGKTATFCSGILQQLDYGVVQCQALVLAPTRELAQQIEKVMRALGDYLGVKVHACVGGTSVREDQRILQAGVHTVVGTPGRVFDMLRRQSLRPDYIKMFVLDEADEMLSRGFKDQAAFCFENRTRQDIEMCTNQVYQLADSAVADEVLSQEHTIDGRVVEVKRTVPREDMEVTGVFRTKKIFVGGLPQFFTDDELKDYFSTYGNIVEYQIMLDHKTGRSRGFGFVTFDNEDSVEKVFSAGKIHELGGKQVEIKRAEPKRSGNSYGGMDGFGAYSSRGHNHGKWDEPYTNFGMNRQCGHFEGSYGGISAASYGGYCGYGYGFGYGRMYGSGGYRFNPYGNSGCGYGGMSMHGRAGRFNRTGSNDNDSPAAARYHPYWNGLVLQNQETIE
ncbi:hypothetical protein S245_061878, partial [Arachis hypogaea]